MATADITPELPTASTWKFERNAGNGAPIEASDDGFALSDVFVAIAITMISAALMIALLHQTSLPAMSCVLLAAAVWFSMILGHVSLRRAEHRRVAVVYDFDDDEEDARAAPTLGEDRVRVAPMARKARVVKVATAKPAPMAETRRAAPARLPKARPDVDDADPALIRDLDLGDFRPRGDTAFATQEPSSIQLDADRRGLGPSGDDGDVNSMLQRLASDISKGRKTGQKPELQPEPKPVSERLPPKLPSGMTAAAEALRTGGAPARAKRVVKRSEAPPPLPPAFPPARQDARPMPQVKPVAKEQTAAARLAAVADALSDEQMDVFLETINGLDDYRARHYQVSVRLRLDNGEMLDGGQMISETRGTGLLGLIEAVKVSSAKRVAVQMIRRGRTGEFFSVVDGEALQTGQFSEDMQTIVGGEPALASRLVLSFSQADARMFTPAQWESLRDIADLGFRFAIEDITDLDMDFELLASNGFAFAKLDAEVFLDGLPIESGRVPAADICRYLSGAGLALIVSRIADETTRAKIMGFGALFGQGPLFGAPRPVRQDVLRQGEAQTAAG
jgi:EAL domain-containing protein (putative c-di-GMP-specific phosphodiesterase class I)